MITADPKPAKMPNVATEVPCQGRLLLSHIYKSYGEKQVLSIPSAEINLPGILAIVGWSGSGKSTLLNILGLIDQPDTKNVAGEPTMVYELGSRTYTISYQTNGRPRVELKDQNGVTAIDEGDFRRNVLGYVFQEHYLHPNLDVEHNVKMPLLAKTQSLSREELMTVCRPLDIHELLDRHVEAVSGGQAQRASILRGLLKGCPLIFGDELTSNIDQDMARTALEGIREMVGDPSHPARCFMWVSHDIHLIADYAQSILLIRNGRLNVVANTFREHPEQILALLREDTKPQGPVAVAGGRHQPAIFFEQLRYICSYAYRDLFKSPRRPTVDFGVIVVSLVFVILFLLAIFKISYGSSKFLELKLSDPRINYLEVIGGEGIGRELNQKHFLELSEVLEGQVRDMKPVYFVRFSILDKRHGGYRPIGNAVTFRPGDPVIQQVVGTHSPAREGDLAPVPEFLDHQDHFEGVVIRREVLDSYGYTGDETEINAKFNGFNTQDDRTIPLVVVDSPLPDNKGVMLREAFYLDGFRRLEREEKPFLAYFLIYPDKIHDTLTLKQLIEKDGRFEVDQALRVLNKIQVVNELKRQARLFVMLSMGAISVMALLFITVTIYRNLYKKRREIGVFLAFGMKRRTLYLFYLAEVFMVAAVTLVLSLLIYLLAVDPLVNNMLMQGSLETVANLKQKLDTAIDLSQLRVPLKWILLTYLGAFTALAVLFFLWITHFSRLKPVALLKEL